MWLHYKHLMIPRLVDERRFQKIKKVTRQYLKQKEKRKIQRTSIMNCFYATGALQTAINRVDFVFS